MTRSPTARKPRRRKSQGHKSQGRKRRATEAAIVAAFDRLVRRVGTRGIGVNALVAEAGVGKGLIYKYFGGLAGVVKSWAEANRLWPTTAELMGISDEAFSGLDATGQITTIVTNHANALRANPIATAVMADELMVPSEVSAALDQARRRLGEEHRALFDAQHATRAYDHRSLMIVLMAAANYLAMRAAHAPIFMGERLDTDDGWAAILRRLERVAVLATRDPEAPIASPRRLPRKARLPVRPS
jgi:AcrR family transcriptional regulator